MEGLENACPEVGLILLYTNFVENCFWFIEATWWNIWILAAGGGNYWFLKHSLESLDKAVSKYFNILISITEPSLLKHVQTEHETYLYKPLYANNNC